MPVVYFIATVSAILKFTGKSLSPGYSFIELIFIPSNVFRFYYIMANEDYLYHAPQVKILEMVVEHCLASSVEDPIVNPEQDW